MKDIYERLWKANQSWEYERVVDHKKHKLRVKIRRNAYDFQSFAVVHRWDGAEWQEIVHWPIGRCNCRSYSYVQQRFDVNLQVFHDDGAGILAEAMKIVA